MASALEEAACVEPLSKNVQRSRWFNLAQRMSQGSVIASESRIQPSKDSCFFLIPISHLVLCWNLTNLYFRLSPDDGARALYSRKRTLQAACSGLRKSADSFLGSCR